MTKYLNIKTQYGVETVDSLERKDFESGKAFKTELKRLTNEYLIAGVQVYVSQRCVK